MKIVNRGIHVKGIINRRRRRTHTEREKVRMKSGPASSQNPKSSFPYKMDETYDVGIKQATQASNDWHQSGHSYAKQASQNEKVGAYGAGFPP